MTEIWKPISGLPNYHVSNTGKVKSLSRIADNGWRKRKTNTRILKNYVQKNGYVVVGIFDGKKLQTKKLHRLVAQEFIPNPENKSTINHKNGIKTDNRLDNLEWATHSENTIHAFRTGLSVISEKSKLVTSERCKKNTGSKSYIAKKVINSLTGEIHDTIRLAAMATGINYQTLYGQLSGAVSNRTSLHLL